LESKRIAYKQVQTDMHSARGLYTIWVEIGKKIIVF